MELIKRHKLWSLVILYFIVGTGVGIILRADAFIIGRALGLCFWGYLFCCFIAVRLAERIWGHSEKV